MKKKNKKIELMVKIGGSEFETDSSFVVDLRDKAEERGSGCDVKKTSKIVHDNIDKFKESGEKVLCKAQDAICAIGRSLKEKYDGAREKIECLKEVVGDGGGVKKIVKDMGGRIGEGAQNRVHEFVDASKRKTEDLFFVRVFRVFFGFFGNILRRVNRVCYLFGWFFLFFSKFFWLFVKKVFGFFVKYLRVDYGKLGGVFRVVGNSGQRNKKSNIDIGRIWGLIGVSFFVIINFLRVDFEKLGAIFDNTKVVNARKPKVMDGILMKLFKKNKKDLEDKIITKSVRKKKMTRVENIRGIKKVLGFVVVLFVLFIPIKLLSYWTGLEVGEKKESIMNGSEIAVNRLMDAANAAVNMEFDSADDNFREAADNFVNIQRELDDINGFLFTMASFVPSRELKLAHVSRNIIASGQIATDMASNMNLAISNLLDENKNKNIYSALENFNKYTRDAMREAELLKVQLSKIDVEILPKKHQGKFVEIKEKIFLMESNLKDFFEIATGLYEFLGMTQDKRYLLVFQNNTEARATGGFIGSYALIDFRNGKIRNLEVPEGGSYDTEGGMRVLVAAPEPMRLVNPLWYFWDANWWPDWPTSARKMAWFYEKSDGPTVDGVVSFTPTFFEGLLKVIGPVELKEYDLVVTSDNFWETVQTIIEDVPNKNNPTYLVSDANRPKKIIGDLAKAVLQVMPERLNKERLVSLMKIVNSSLQERHIMFYFVDKDLEDRMEKYGWSGKMKETQWDYLNVVNTNIAGQKTDKVISQGIEHKASVLGDGTVVNVLKIKRKHNGKKGDNFTGVRNVNWLRVYVPEGSYLIEASGFSEPDRAYFDDADDDWLQDVDLEEERNAMVDGASKTKVYNKFNKTVFANWTMLDPGEEQEIVFKYQLPFKVGMRKSKSPNKGMIERIRGGEHVDLIPYALLVQKQAGFKNSEFDSVLELDSGFKIVWRYPTGIKTTEDGWNIREPLVHDAYYAVILERR